MALTSVELIDILRQEASRIEQGGDLQQNSISLSRIINEIKTSGIKANGIDLQEIVKNAKHREHTVGIVQHLRRWADTLEKQLLDMLDLPVDISFLRTAA